MTIVDRIDATLARMAQDATGVRAIYLNWKDREELAAARDGAGNSLMTFANGCAQYRGHPVRLTHSRTGTSMIYSVRGVARAIPRPSTPKPEKPKEPEEHRQIREQLLAPRASASVRTFVPQTAPPRPKLSFEDQLAMVQAGRATIATRFDTPRGEPNRTLGGVASGAL